MFLLKKIIAPIFFPLPICILMMVVGLAMLWFTRKQKLGKMFVTTGAIVLALLSYSAISDRILKPLEHHYEPMNPAVVLADEALKAKISYIVILGAGSTSDPQIPITSRLSPSSLARLIEGIRLHHLLQNTKLIVSGGSVFGSASDAEVMAETAKSLGVDQQNLVLESESKDTEQEAEIIKNTVGTSPFILVTSASHMPRSVALFQKQGMNPIPAPTDYGARQDTGIAPADFYPGAGALLNSQRAFYEYMGIVWAKVRGKA